MIAWLAGQGLVGDALYATVGYNRGYVSTGQSLHSPLVGVVTILAPLLPLALGTALAWRRRGQTVPFSAGAAWWLGLTLLGALASGRTYPHYFLQAVAPAAICLALALDYARTSYRARAVTGSLRSPGDSVPAVTGYGRVVIGIVVTWAFAVPLISLAALQHDRADAAPGSDTVAYYAYYWQHLTGGLSDTAYGNRLDPRVERNVTVAGYLKARPRSPRLVYVWGNAPWIYYLSGYGHAARFLSAFYRPTVPGSGAGVLPGLQKQPPPYIVVIEPPNPPAAGLSPWLRGHYSVVFRVENAVVYGLRVENRD